MLYRHAPRFQILIQLALKKTVCNPDNSPNRNSVNALRGENGANLKCSYRKIENFIKLNLQEKLQSNNSGFVEEVDSSWANARDCLSAQDSLKLWNHFTEKRHMTDVFRENPHLINNLYSNRLVSNALKSFYEIEESEQSDIDEASLVGNYFCYKTSFINKRYIVKSEFNFGPKYKEHLNVSEKQEWNDETETKTEESTGFALFKSGNLWVFLKTVKEKQPRIMCFYHMSRAKLNIRSKDESIIRMFGQIMELDRNNRFYTWYVALSSVKNDKVVWKNRHKGKNYDESAQIGTFPIKERQGDQDFHLFDQVIMDFLKSGNYPND